LTRSGFIEAYEDNDYNDNTFVAYRLTGQGADWLLDNQDKLQIRVSNDPPRQSELTLDEGIPDDDMPF
jgi:hypothetical protein